MKTVNSISGGKTSAYIYANYPADYNVFSLVRTEDKNCMFPDPKLRQMVSDKIGQEFIGTLEMDEIIYTMFDLEQMFGNEITWVSGITFDEVVRTKGGWLPNKLHRYCTTHLKIEPIFHWWYNNIQEPIDMRIGFRANELRRVKKMNDKRNKNGLLEIKTSVSKHPNGRNKWEIFEWQNPIFPLVEDIIFKDNIVEYWINKPVRFADINNCVGCFHRNEILLNKLFNSEHSNKMDWFVKQEIGRNRKDTWRSGITYEKIKEYKLQLELSFDDFSSCDSGFCGI